MTIFLWVLLGIALAWAGLSLLVAWAFASSYQEWDKSGRHD